VHENVGGFSTRKQVVPFQLDFSQPCAGGDFDCDIRRSGRRHMRLWRKRSIRRNGEVGRLRQGLLGDARAGLGQCGGR
jgi:hypothetical protein